LPIVIKIDPYNFELYRFEVGAFFETQCMSKITQCWSFRNGQEMMLVFAQ